MTVTFDAQTRSTTFTTLNGMSDRLGSENSTSLSKWELKQFAVVETKDGHSALKCFNAVQRFFIHFAQLFGFCKHITLVDFKATYEFLQAFANDVDEMVGPHSGKFEETRNTSLKVADNIIGSLVFVGMTEDSKIEV